MPRPSAHLDLFTPPGPEGFTYLPEVISTAEEAELLSAFAALPFAPFAFHGFLGRRRVVSFGWRYDFEGRGLEPATAMPAFLLPLRDRAAEIGEISPDILTHALVTEYAEHAAIGWHRDKSVFGDVIAFSFGGPCTLRFRLRDSQGWTRRNVAVAPRSAYVLRGPAREAWEHSIPPVRGLRYSVTFRTMRG
jgi:alkylated DNA repair dioxygenase AlkB